MSKKALLDICAASRRKLIYHEEDGKTYLETRQDAEPLIEAARILADVPPDPQTGWRFVGFIPDAIWNKACAEGWLHDKAKWRAWMRDRDNRAYNGGRENPF
jgi:hypothetical protein